MTIDLAKRRAYVTGVGLILLGGVCLSSGGILIRYVQDVDIWAILFYRSVGFIGLVFSVILYRHGRQTPQAFRTIGRNGLFLAVALGGGFTCYVFAMLMTAVASVSFIISAGPLFAAILGWIILRERVSLATWMVIVGAAVGMGLMFVEGLAGGRLTGTIIAMGIPTTFAVMVVLIRRAGDMDMLPATCLAGVVSLMAGFIISETLVVSLEDLLFIIFIGVGQLGMGFMLITLGTRYVPAAESALLSLSEAVLAPIWAWLFLMEIPASLAMAGGVIVLTCVGVQAVMGIQRERRARQG
jgi:DME family drug/metabolite transporter